MDFIRFQDLNQITVEFNSLPQTCVRTFKQTAIFLMMLYCHHGAALDQLNWNLQTSRVSLLSLGNLGQENQC